MQLAEPVAPAAQCLSSPMHRACCSPYTHPPKISLRGAARACLRCRQALSSASSPYANRIMRHSLAQHAPSPTRRARVGPCRAQGTVGSAGSTCSSMEGFSAKHRGSLPTQTQLSPHASDGFKCFVASAEHSLISPSETTDLPFTPRVSLAGSVRHTHQACWSRRLPRMLCSWPSRWRLPHSV